MSPSKSFGTGPSTALRTGPSTALRTGIDARFHVAYPGFAFDVDLALPGRGITVLYGPSGSGKTTFLRCLAGLEMATGHLRVNGEAWQADGFLQPAHRRPVGVVFQEARLFAHLTVGGNLDYAVRRAGKAPGADRQGIVDLLGIAPLLGRSVSRLSGGESQRVAIARALLTAPRLLLLDEPLAALDLARKREILPYLERLHEALEIPVIYVTHAADEVTRLADHLVLMDAGRVTAAGPAVDLMARLDLPLARDEEAGVVVVGRVGAQDADYHLTRFDFPGGSILAGLRDLSVGATARLSIHARDVSLALSPAEDSSILNRLPATIRDFADGAHPAHLLVGLDAGGTFLLARITRRSRDQLGLRPGQSVWAQIKSVALID